MNPTTCVLVLGCLLIPTQGCNKNDTDQPAVSKAEPAPPDPETTAARDVSALLEPVLKESGLPSLVGAVVVGDEIVGVGAVGVRKLGDDTPVKKQDKYHIGSCTKPMTATLTAILIEDGLLSWDTTIGEVLGNEIPKIHNDYRDVTIEQLLAHVGGFPKSAPRTIWSAAWRNQGEMTPVEQRMIYVTDLLALPPDYPPGEESVYSNQGYAVAGVMLETLAGKPWEDLMRERLFVPLGMTSAGFRAPASSDVLDHPWGHQGTKPIAPEPSGDNPSAIAPAGAVHCTVTDWAKFARFHLRCETGNILKNKESFDRLHSTLENSGSRGVGGWLVHDMERFGGHAIQMTGSNTMWYALLWIFPGYDMAIVVATNSGAPNAFQTCDRAVVALMGEFRN